MLQAWLDGRFVPMDEARVSAFDAGFQHGVGLFETMSARHGRVFRGLEHMERMRRSAKELGLADTLRPEALVDACEATLAANDLQHARVRVTLTGGDMNMLARSAEDVRHDPTILIHAQPPTPYPPALFEKGVGVRVADAQLNVADPFAGHKTLWYWPRLHALQRAAAAGMQEALWFDVTRALACGCVSNAFIVRHGALVTPVARGEEEKGAGVRSPVLPGITRAAVLSIAEESGVEVRRERIEIGAILDADEIFLTNSSWHVLPVVQVEQRTIGSGQPGEVTRTLRAGLMERMDREARAARPSA
jgi:branched-subunit amino acid aminotransferase/4-amino-4-deoxychorismate lyase